MIDENGPRRPETAGAGAPPTAGERAALAGAYQAAALRRDDPLSANLGVITGDLLHFAHSLAPAVKAGLAAREGATEDRHRRSAADFDAYLKLVRQIDRLAQLERQAAPAARGGAEPR